MNNHPANNIGPLEDNNARLLHLYNNKRNEGGLPTLKKSISRNTLLNNSLSPTRPLFNNTKADGRQLTVETAVFPENTQPLFQNDLTVTKRSSSTPVATVKFRIHFLYFGDTRSVISGSESTRSNKRQQKKKASTTNVASSFVNPTDIFAQNLSDAVMDADDSDDLECYVYRDKPNNNNNTASYTIAPWSYNEQEPTPYYYDRHYSSTGTESNTDGCESAAAYNKEKYSNRRPVLRSTVSEIPHSGAMRSHNSPKKFTSRPFTKHHTSINYYTNPSEDEEFTPLVRSRPLRRRKGTSSHGSNAAKSPLADVEVVGISNVLGTQKELIFNLQVRARNSNWWTIRMTNTAFSVFASSHYVPTAMLMAVNNSTTNMTMVTMGADPAEFLGTIYHLEDPLIYQSGGLFQSVTSTATSQIQIKNPGSTKDDNSGNERWSLLIRYPYELTVRGVLKYQILPYLPTLTQLHSVRVCKMSRIDPATGKISDNVPMPEKSICDDPSPVEGSIN
ncbi:hypothetical protein INT47_007146 [Mucor saturninus]|uniref:Uncharacterized protein n=1 Tax=Mucor saturninus TaxID=64648 RepID=A0A8H7R6I5_9FUNG|nr:hypothetical protein INT47_007146 [Mucor saturninus]